MYLKPNCIDRIRSILILVVDGKKPSEEVPQLGDLRDSDGIPLVTPGTDVAMQFVIFSGLVRVTNTVGA